MSFDFLDDVFLLHFPLKAAQCIFDGFAFLNPNLGHSVHPHPVAIEFRLSHTSMLMATCPLCSARAAKRYCPAKDFQICAVCCGTKREIEIDCPSSCAHLKASRSYEAAKPIVDTALANKVARYDANFVKKYNHVLDRMNEIVVETRSSLPWLVDLDVIEVYKALAATMRTLSSGIYYESVPDGPARLALFRQLKDALDEFMAPDHAIEHPILKSSEAEDILDFLTYVAEINSSDRPRSRRYLDWICESFGYQQPQSSGLIIP
jgi:hypothetical protein